MPAICVSPVTLLPLMLAFILKSSAFAALTVPAPVKHSERRNIPS